MKRLDLENVQEAGEYTALPAGGYICQITGVTDDASKQYLKIEFDIVHGQHKGYYQALLEKKGKWYGNIFRSYRESALSFFKQFITAVEHSNTKSNYKFDFDEKTLIGKYVGLVFGDEEYINDKGQLKTRLQLSIACSTERIRNGDFVVPELKRLEQLPLSASDFGQEVDAPW